MTCGSTFGFDEYLCMVVAFEILFFFFDRFLAVPPVYASVLNGKYIPPFILSLDILLWISNVLY